MRRKYGLVVLLVVTGGVCMGQQPGFSLQPGLQYGKIISSTTENNENRQVGFVVNLNRQTAGESYWQFDHKYPQVGLEGAVRFFPENPFLKSAFTLIPYLEFNIWKTSFGTLQIKHGTGLAYVTGDLKSTSQLLLGSQLNAATMLDAGYQFKSQSVLELKIGASVNHISNGNLIQPNAGLNSWLTYINLVYFPKNKQNARPTFVRQLPGKRWHLRLGAGLGFYDYQKEESHIQHNFQVTTMAFYQHSTRFRTGVGLEVGKSGSANRIQPAAYLEEEVLIGHMVTRYGIGVYLGQSQPVGGRAYEKVGIAWYPAPLKSHIPRGFSIGTNIKAHGFRAAHVEITSGFLF